MLLSIARIKVSRKAQLYYCGDQGHWLVGVQRLIAVSGAFFMCVAIFTSNTAFALGIGSAQINSFIGQPLQVSIPLMSVDGINDLKVSLIASSLQDDRLDLESHNLEVNIDRSDNQPAILISTVALVNEPYITFELLLDDLSSSLQKEFTVLLDLDSSTQVAGSNSTGTISYAPVNDSASKLRITRMPPSGDGGAPQADLLGPYEWAEPGNIPARFGAVIDGQSLWRVARRINKAMNVSIDQMMLALYLQNPKAFSSASVDSLQVGSYLTIPSREFVTQYTELGAVAQLKGLSLGVSGDGSLLADGSSLAEGSLLAEGSSLAEGSLLADGSTLAEGSLLADGSLLAESSSLAEGSTLAEGSLLAEGSTSADGSLLADGSTLAEGQADFQTSDLGQDIRAGSVDVDAGAPGSQEIISSLAATVGNLTQELINKDKRIQYLEEKIDAMENYSGINQDKLLGSDAASSKVKSQLAQPATVSESWVSGRIWWLLPFALVGLVGILFRERFSALWADLNLFGQNDEVHFEESLIDIENDIDIAISKSDFHPENQEYSILEAVQKKMREEENHDAPYSDLAEINENSAMESLHKTGMREEVSDQEYDEENADGIEIETEFGGLMDEESEDSGSDEHDLDEYLVEFASDAEQQAEQDDQALSFDQRFELLLKEEDFAFAKELLEFAKHNEIDDQRYHYERLRLCLEMRDKDGFYDYYYKIEDQVPGFAAEWRNGIAVMISLLGESKT